MAPLYEVFECDHVHSKGLCTTEKTLTGHQSAITKTKHCSDKN